MGNTYVCRNYQPHNEITTPIVGEPSYRNSGIIKAVTEEGEKIQVGKITYESFENEEFQYIITPFWEIIDTLPSAVFQGIPGIDMDLRLEHYYRVNYVPVFMTERTPGPNREDLWELLESVQLDYYDRLEWLIRTDLRAAVDNLIVERAREEKRSGYAKSREELTYLIRDGQYGDEVRIDSISMLGRSTEECISALNRLMHYGMKLKVTQEKINLEPDDYKAFLPIFAMLYQKNYKKRKKQQQAGIDVAKETGVYRGRKPKRTDEELLKDTIQSFQQKKIPLEEALRRTGLSKSTFYRRMRQEKKP